MVLGIWLGGEMDDLVYPSAKANKERRIQGSCWSKTTLNLPWSVVLWTSGSMAPGKFIVPQHGRTSSRRQA